MTFQFWWYICFSDIVVTVCWYLLVDGHGLPQEISMASKTTTKNIYKWTLHISETCWSWFKSSQVKILTWELIDRFRPSFQVAPVKSYDHNKKNDLPSLPAQYADSVDLNDGLMNNGFVQWSSQYYSLISCVTQHTLIYIAFKFGTK